MGTFSVTGSSGGIVNHQDGASSEWFTYTSDMVEDSASSGRTSSSVNQPIPEEQAWEREARAQEHDRISAEVETITSACENLEAAMVRKAQILLHQRGVTLGDPEDVKRALQLALHDDWEHAIDDRKRHFTVLRRNFGTARCERWNPFIDELRGLGNHQCKPEIFKSWLPLILIIKRNETKRVVKRVGKKEANLQESDFLYVNGRRLRGGQVGRLRRIECNGGPNA
ncbi:unnamed protein product [Arabidopsis thaliana]|uniref:Uncharacterized protein n=1 Tax=Arabidopsis thaliana TaxID=3702 RepID=A0A5S9YJ47_ARATH|nr:unnamed protein product [Arabidopsis thaliana]